MLANNYYRNAGSDYDYEDDNIAPPRSPSIGIGIEYEVFAL